MGCCGSVLSTHADERPAVDAHETRFCIVQDETLNNFDTRSRYSFRPVEQDWVVSPDEVLGEGLNGCVTRARSKLTGQPCALKVLRKRSLSPYQLENLRREVNNYLKVDHPHIARLLHVYEDEYNVSLVMELCSGKELFEQLIDVTQFGEAEAQSICYQALLAIAYLHKHGMVHCDLKLENFLYDRDSEGAGSLKLIDFGFSKVWDRKTEMHQAQGTPSYTAPEVFNGSFTDKCDLWSFGVVAFLVLSGNPPFPMGANEEAARNAIKTGRYRMKPERWVNVSLEARDFVSKLLVVDPDQRMSAEQCFEHSWMKAVTEQMRTSSEITQSAAMKEKSELLQALRMYNQCSHMKRAALAMIAHHLSSSMLSNVYKTFIELDTDRTGTLTRDNIREALREYLSEEEMDEIFSCMDTARDGEIHYSEFVAAVMGVKVQINQTCISEAFQLFDVSRTGRISRGDLEVVLGARGFEVDIDTLIAECGGCSPRKGITFKKFEEHLRSSGARMVQAEPEPRCWRDGAMYS